MSLITLLFASAIDVIGHRLSVNRQTRQHQSTTATVLALVASAATLPHAEIVVAAEIPSPDSAAQPLCRPTTSIAPASSTTSHDWKSIQLPSGESVTLGDFRQQTRQSIEQPDGLPSDRQILPPDLAASLGRAPEPSPPEPASTPSITAEALIYPLPEKAEVSSGFGLREHPINGNPDFHQGIDIPAKFATPVRAVLSGTVRFAGDLGDLGIAVTLTHEGDRRTRYGHLLVAAAAPDTLVKQGDVIGYVGSTGTSTGPHLHFEYWEKMDDLWIALDVEAQLAAAETIDADTVVLAIGSSPTPPAPPPTPAPVSPFKPSFQAASGTIPSCQ